MIENKNSFNNIVFSADKKNDTADEKVKHFWKTSLLRAFLMASCNGS